VPGEIEVADNVGQSELAQTCDRSRLAWIWYNLVRWTAGVLFVSMFGFRASGRRNIPRSGGALLVCNHLSHLDVFLLGVPPCRPLNYVARSTLFFPPLGAFIRSVGGFPIQREGMGTAGVKETLKRVRRGGIVVLFPEGTRSRDGELADLKSGIAVLAQRAQVPVIPAAVAGTFEAWPRTWPFPIPRPVRIHFGQPIEPDELKGLNASTVTSMIRARILECQRIARLGLARDMECDPPSESLPSPIDSPAEALPANVPLALDRPEAG
jgi:1-acyl-sn-glycerol-3-phosphate acyltransferase